MSPEAQIVFRLLRDGGEKTFDTGWSTGGYGYDGENRRRTYCRPTDGAVITFRLNRKARS